MTEGEQLLKQILAILAIVLFIGLVLGAEDEHIEILQDKLRIAVKELEFSAIHSTSARAALEEIRK